MTAIDTTDVFRKIREHSADFRGSTDFEFFDDEDGTLNVREKPAQKEPEPEQEKPIKYKDVRLRTAQDAYEKLQPEITQVNMTTRVVCQDIALVNKTTRVGCTTSMTIVPIHQLRKTILGIKSQNLRTRKQVLVVEPTNRIIVESIQEGIKKYGALPEIGLKSEDIQVVHVLPNWRCAYNQILMRQNPDLKKLPTLPLYTECKSCEALQSQCTSDLCTEVTEQIYLSSPCRTCIEEEIPDCNSCEKAVPEGCKQCKFKSCSAYARCHVSDVYKYRDTADVFAITSQKLTMVMQQHMAPKPWWALERGYVKPADVIYGILKQCDVCIFDEVDRLHNINKRQTTIAHVEIAENTTDVDLTPKPNLSVYNAISGEIYPYTKAIIQRYQAVLEDPAVLDAINRAKEKALSPDYHEKHINERVKQTFTTSIEGLSTTELFGALMQEVTNMVTSEDYREYNLKIKQVARIYAMADVAVAKTHSIGIIRSNEKLTAIMTSTHKGDINAVNEFSRDMQAAGNLVVLTSATIDETYPYLDGMRLTGTKIQHTTFGEGGDPLKTNEKMLIFASKRKMSISRGVESLMSEKEDICRQIIEIDKVFGEANHMIIAANIETAKAYEEELGGRKVHYYNADTTVGVASNCRIATLIGEAWKPSNTFDTTTSGEHESKVALEFSRHADTAQALFRVKDPEGKQPSAVFAHGAVLRDLTNDVSWGNHRQIHYEAPEKQGAATKVEVTHDGDVTMPHLTEWTVFNELIFRGFAHLDGEYAYSLAKLRRDQQYNIICAEAPWKVPSNNKNIILGTFHGHSVQELLYGSELLHGKSKLQISFEEMMGVTEEDPEGCIRIPKVPIYFKGDFFRKTQCSCSLISILQLMKHNITTDEIINYAVGDEEIHIETTTADGLCKLIKFDSVEPEYAHKLCSHLYLHGMPSLLAAGPDNTISVFVLTTKAYAPSAKNWAQDILKAAKLYNTDSKTWRCTTYPNRVTHRRGKPNEEVLILPGTRFYVMGARHLRSREDLQVDIYKPVQFVGDDVPEVVYYRNPEPYSWEPDPEEAAEELQQLWIENAPVEFDEPELDQEAIKAEREEAWMEFYEPDILIQAELKAYEQEICEAALGEAYIMRDTRIPEIAEILTKEAEEALAELEMEGRSEAIEADLDDEDARQAAAEEAEREYILAQDRAAREAAANEFVAELEKRAQARLQKYMKSRGLLGNPIASGNRCLRSEHRVGDTAVRKERLRAEKKAAKDAEKNMKTLQKAFEKAEKAAKKARKQAGKAASA